MKLPMSPSLDRMHPRESLQTTLPIHHSQCIHFLVALLLLRVELSFRTLSGKWSTDSQRVCISKLLHCTHYVSPNLRAIFKQLCLHSILGNVCAPIAGITKVGAREASSALVGEYVDEGDINDVYGGIGAELLKARLIWPLALLSGQ